MSDTSERTIPFTVGLSVRVVALSKWKPLNRVSPAGLKATASMGLKGIPVAAPPIPLAGSPYPVWKIPFPANAAGAERESKRKKKMLVPYARLNRMCDAMEAT